MPWSTNRILYAADWKEEDAFVDRFLRNVSLEENAQIRELMEGIGDAMTIYEPGGRILTDDNAPVELLGMQVIDELITEETKYYKDIFREQGIQGLLDSL